MIGRPLRFILDYIVLVGCRYLVYCMRAQHLLSLQYVFEISFVEETLQCDR